jgi:hypothetical protein
MKKLRLDVEELSVVSFGTAPAREPRGTVQGHLATPTCNITSGVDSCWCSEFVSCECTAYA